jgi:hypothetical protein
MNRVKSLITILAASSIPFLCSCGVINDQKVDVSNDFFQKTQTEESQSGAVYYPCKLGNKDIYLTKNPKKDLNYSSDKVDSLKVREVFGTTFDGLQVYSIEEIILGK